MSVWCGGRLVGLAPLYLDQRPAGRRLLPLGIGITDHVDVLADDAMRAAVLATMTRVVGELPWVEWEMAELAANAAARVMPPPPGCVSRDEPVAPCPVLALAGENGLGHVPPAMRRKLRMTRHRIARHGAGRFIVTREQPVAWWIDHLERLHGARWASRGEGGVLADSGVVAFHRDAADGMARRGLLRMHALELGGTVAGVAYGFAHGTCTFAYLGGFDPAFAYWSPGTALIGAVIAEAVCEGRTRLDFLRGSESYKYRWGAIDRMNVRRVITRGAS